MSVLVTGIDGFVGSHLAGLLLSEEAGPAARIAGLVFNRSRTHLIEHLRPRLELLEVDVRRKEDVFAAIKKTAPRKIYHLAGQAFVPNSMKDPLETYSINIDGGLHVLEAVRQFAPECAVLIVSSGEVYGRVPPDAEVTEAFPLKPENPYAASKAAIDLIAQQYRMTFGLNAIVVRAFNHLGPGQNEIFVGSAFAKQVAEAKLGKRKPVISVGNLEARRDFTDVRDVVRAYAALLRAPVEHGVYNVCTGRGVAVRELLDLLIRTSGVAVKIEQDPSRMRSVDSPVVVGSSARLTAATGWKPSIPLEKTLADLLAWWERRLNSQK